jgi:hypothetical protein
VWSWIADALQIGQGAHSTGLLETHDVILIMFIIILGIGWIRYQKKQLKQALDDWNKLNEITKELIQKVDGLYCSSKAGDSDQLVRREECLHLLETIGAQADTFEDIIASTTKDRYAQYVNLINTMEKITRMLDDFRLTGEERREEMRLMIHEMAVEMKNASNGLFKICEMLIGRLPKSGRDGD